MDALEPGGSACSDARKATLISNVSKVEANQIFIHELLPFLLRNR